MLWLELFSIALASVLVAGLATRYFESLRDQELRREFEAQLSPNDRARLQQFCKTGRSWRNFVMLVRMERERPARRKGHPCGSSDPRGACQTELIDVQFQTVQQLTRRGHGARGEWERSITETSSISAEIMMGAGIARNALH